MKNEWKVFVGTALSGVLLASTISIAGQQKPAPADPVTVERQKVVQAPVAPGVPVPPDAPLPPAPSGDTFVFVSSEFSFDGQTVKGAPYSAQAVTESTQTLSDGNRIVNKSTSSVYRDSEGRTRREQSLRSFGPFSASGDAPQTIFISDPVAGVSYTLDPRTHVARKMPAFRFEFKTPAPGRRPSADVLGGDVVFERTPGVAVNAASAGVAVSAASVGAVAIAEGPPVFTLRTPPPPGGPAGQGEFIYKREGGSDKNVVTEKLGIQIVEGVAAEGSRTTVTIPAGEIGNERAIQVISERWYSQELKTAVMTRHSDPRFGETVYRLTNISREEPAHTLFEVPTDYTVKDDPGPMMRTRKLPAPPTP